MAIERDDDPAASARRPAFDRAVIGRPPGLDWTQTYVLKAACDVAMALGERRLTLDQVEERLSASTRISRQQIERSLGPLGDRGYLYADDAPSNPAVVLHVTSRGLEEYCYRFVRGYGRLSLAVLQLACQTAPCDAVELARAAGQPELLVEHVLEIAAQNGLLRLRRHAQYVVVQEVKPQLRRLVNGAA